MTNEVALRDTDSWAPMLPSINMLAQGISDTEFVPKTLRGKPYAVAACVLTGRELGIGPMESLQKIYMVDGRPSMSAELMRSLVLRAGHSIRFSDQSDKAVTIEGRRAGEENWTKVTWTLADAQRIGVANKDVWKKYPRAMLANRATAELCRLIFPDALAGLSYTPEEIEDEKAATAAPVTVTRARAAKPKAPEPVEPAFEEPEPVADEETGEIIEAEIVEPTFDEPEPEEPTEPLITGPQLAKVNILLTNAGITERGEKLAYVAGVVGRDIASSKELTKAEASKVIEALS